MKRKLIKSVSIVLLIAMFLSCFNLMGVAEELENLPNVRTHFIYQYNKKANVAKDLEREDALRSPVLSDNYEYDSKYGEAVERKSDYTTYQVNNKEFLTVFDTIPNKYIDKNGEEKDIDLNIEEKTFSYENNTNSVHIQFAKSFSDKKAITVSLPDDSYAFSLIPVDGDYSKEVVEGNAIIYNDVFENTDVQYTLNELGYKEDIILRAPTSAKEYQYFLDFDGKVEQKDGSVLLFNKQGKVLYTLNAPVMMDANEQTSSDIKLKIGEKNSRTIISIIADNKWLEAEERVYPVVIDPSVTIPQTELQLYNTSMPYNDSRMQILNGINNNGLFVVSNNLYLNSYHTNIALIDVADTITDFLPDNATIENADLVLNQSGTYLTNNNAIFECRQVNTIWNSTQQFTTFDIINDSSVTGENNIVNTNQLTQQEIESGERRFEITDTVDAWIYGRADNNGLLVKANNDAGGIFYNLNAAEQYASKKPKIEITWSLTAVDTLSQHALSAHVSPIVSKDINNISSLEGVFVSGQANSHDDVYYQMYCENTAVNYAGTAINGNQAIYPNSSVFGSNYPQNASVYAGNTDNWQAPQIYTDTIQLNKLYQVYATAQFHLQTVKSIRGDSFVVYEVIQGDTLANIANYYGISIQTLQDDNDLENTLLTEGSTLFIRNPKVYEPKDVVKSEKSFDLTNRAHSESVDFASGNFYLESTDVSVPFYNDTLSIFRRYNSGAAGTDGVLGYGWQFEYAEFLSTDEQQNINYRRSDGSTIQFVFNGSTYACQSGYHLTLAINDVVSGEDIVKEYTIQFSDNTQKTFDALGNLTRISYKGGYSTSLFYDQNYKLVKVQAPTGKEYQFEYNTNNKIKKVKLPDNCYLNYTYDADGNLVEFKDQLNNTTTYTYDANHRMLSWTDGNNVTRLSNTYSSDGKVSSQTDANNRVTQFLYFSNETDITNAAGQITQYYFDSFKRTVRIKKSASVSVYYTYNYNNDVLTHTDELGHVTTYTYDENGNVLTATRFDEKSLVFTYDVNGNLLTKKDYKNYTTTYSYDSNNNLVGIINPDNSTQAFSYDSHGMLASITDANQAQTLFQYNSNGLLESITYANNAVERYYYNVMNLLSKKVDADNSQTLFSYDACGRKTTEILPGQATVTYAYDAADNLISSTDARGATTTYSYDGQGNLLSETNALNSAVSYTYDSLDNVASKTDGLGNTVYYNYDNNGKLLCATFDNRVIESHQYDALGNVTRDNQPSGYAYHQYSYDYRFNQISRSQIGSRYTNNVYDDNGNLISTTDNAGNTTSYTYDSMNRVISTTDPNGAVSTIEYDGNGNVVKTIDPLNHITLYAYDCMNNNTRITYPNGGIVVNTYDSLNRLHSTTDAEGNTTTFSYYYNTDNIAVKSLPNEAQEEYAYDANRNLISFEDAEGYTTLYNYDYLNRLIATIHPDNGIENIEYDSNSNVTKTTNQTGGTMEYTYDIQGNVLTQKDYYNHIYSFEYDLSSNMTKLTDPAGNETLFSYNQYGELSNTIYPDETEFDIDYNEIGLKEIEYIDGVKHTYEYDANGNIVSLQKGSRSTGQTLTYTYDLNNNMLSQTLQADRTTSYTYDVMGNVISQTNPAGNITRNYYDLNGNVIKQTDALGREYLYAYDEMNQCVEVTDPLLQTKAFEYDNLGHITKETDEAGHYNSYAYNAIGKVSSSTDKKGNVTAYKYDKSGNLIKTTNADGGIFENLYDKNGNLIEAQDALNNVTSYTYNSMNQCVSKQLPSGDSYLYAYDVMGNLCQTTDPLGNITSQTTNKYGKIASFTSATGVTTTYRYDVLGRLKKQSTPLGNINYQYDGYGNLVSQSDVLGNTTAYTYDALNRQLSVTDALNNSTTYSYDANGNVVSEVSPSGAVKNYSYDVLNRVVTETSLAQGLITAKTYDAAGNVTGITQTSNGVTRTQAFSYDNNGNNTAQIINGVETDFVYNAMNQVTQQIAVLDNNTHYTTAFTYDANGNVLTKTAANGGVETYSYDENGNCSAVTDARNYTTEYTYNALGKITKVENALGAETCYSYNALMNVIKVKNACNNETNYTYDNYGRLIEAEDALGNSQSYVYNAKGLLTSKTDANNQTVSYSYDALGRLIEKTYSLSDSVEYEYDAASRRTSMTDYTGETQYTYNAAGNLTKVLMPDNNEINYSYNGFGDVVQITYPNGESVQYLYNSKGLLTSMIQDTGYVNYLYNNLNQLVKKTFADNNTTVNQETFSYSSTGRVTAATVVDANNNTISAHTYTYDLADNIISETQSGNGQTLTKAYTYDALGQVKTQTTTDANNHIISAKSFNYDLVGNQVERSSDGSQTTRVYNANNQLTRTIKGSVITDYTYDANGNLISEESGSSETEYTYDKENNLLSVVKDDILQMSAVYNGDGDRIMAANKIATPKNANSLIAGSISGSTVDDTYSSSLYNSLLSAGGASVNASDYDITTYVNDVTKQNKQVLMEYNASGNVTEEYYYGLQREIYKHDTATEYYMYDGRGSVANLTTSTGAMKIAYSYDTFGEATITPAANVAGTSNVFDYNAEATDYNTGFQYLRSRYYNPVNASFISKDSYKGNLSNPQTQNNYSYTGNNPVNRKDPSGKSWQGDLLKELFGGIGKNIVAEIKNSGIIKQPTISDIKNIAFNTLFMPSNSDSKELAEAKIVTGTIVKDISEGLKDTGKDIENELKEELKESVKESIMELPSKAWKSINEWAAKKIISSIFDKENLSALFTKMQDKTISFIQSSVQRIYETIKSKKEQVVKNVVELGKKALVGLVQNIVIPTIVPMAQEVFGLFAYNVLPALGTVFGRQLLSAGGYILGESARGLFGAPQALRAAFAPMREDAKDSIQLGINLLNILYRNNKNNNKNKDDVGYVTFLSSTGLIVYIITGNRLIIPSTKDNAVVIKDLRVSDNPDFQILNSYKILDPLDKKGILDVLIKYDRDYPTSDYEWIRKDNYLDMFLEWVGHNILWIFFIERGRTQHVDIDNDGANYAWLKG